MLTLYQFEPAWGLPNTSPFCMKLETYLRMTQLDYRVDTNADLQKAPKGKLPYIEDKGCIIADSNLIIEYLKTIYGDPLDGHLSPVDSAIALAMRRLIEENLYWALVYSRWIDEENWLQTKALYFSDLPPLLNLLVPKIARKTVTQSLQGHGMGRHSESEIYQIAALDLQALSDFLQAKPFFMGDQPTTLDASAYSCLANVLNENLFEKLKDSLPSLSLRL